MEEKIKISNQPDIFRLILPAIWSLGCLFMSGVLILGFYQNPSRASGLFLVFVLILSLGILVFNQVIWRLFGKSIIVIKNDFINIQYKLNILKREEIILRKNVVLIDFSEEKSSAVRNFWGFDKGKILIKTSENEYRFGNGLDKRDSIFLLKS